MKKFLKDDVYSQRIPDEFLRFEGDCEGLKESDKYFIMLKTGKNEDGYSFQVGFTSCARYANNIYSYYIFDPEDNIVFSNVFKVWFGFLQFGIGNLEILNILIG